MASNDTTVDPLFLMGLPLVENRSAILHARQQNNNSIRHYVLDMVMHVMHFEYNHLMDI